MTDDELRELLAGRVAAVRGRLAAACARAGRDPAGVTLVAVTKSVSPRVAALLPELGVPDLGEGRPQELWRKADAIPGARWHLVGHLQRNKVERTAPLLTLLHSADSERLLAALDAEGQRRGSPLPVLLEVNCSREPAKGGFPPEALPAVAAREWPGLAVRGLMTMAAHSDDPEAARPTFRELRELRDRAEQISGRAWPELSMGMSGDFEVGAEEGATLVRVGTTLFAGLEGE